MHKLKITESAKYISDNKESLVSIWEERARKEILAAEDTRTYLLRNHLSELLDDLSKSLEHASVSKEPRKASETFFIKSRSERHGESRTGKSTTYRVDEVLEEYVIFRQVITDQLIDQGLEDLYVVEALNRMFELAALQAVKSFVVKSERAKQKIIATIVHDIRSPIGVAKSALEVLENFITPSELGREMYGMIGRSLDRSLEMISSSLDNFSAESRSKITLSFERVDLNNIFNRALADLDQVYGNRLDIKMNDDKVEGVFAHGILVRILENLISNAFKFGNSESPVMVSLTNKENVVELSVHNWGKPIPAENLDKMFEMFETSSTSKELKDKGWGLGLSHIHLAVRAHKGSVKVTSTAKEGTEFIILLKKESREVGDKLYSLE